ncbi:MAG: hypothetical protein AAGI66_10090 [Cyanobacteria bacterium P01_H01_bin.74]
MRGQTKVVLCRRQRENVLLVGDYNEARFGLLVSLLTSFMLKDSPMQGVFYLIDRTVPGAPWDRALLEAHAQLLDSVGYEAHFAARRKEAGLSIAGVSALLHDRLAVDEEDRDSFKDVFLVMADPDKLEALCQVPNKYGNLEDSELGKQLQQIFVKGPAVGIYTFWLLRV